MQDDLIQTLYNIILDSITAGEIINKETLEDFRELHDAEIEKDIKEDMQWDG